MKKRPIPKKKPIVKKKKKKTLKKIKKRIVEIRPKKKKKKFQKKIKRIKRKRVSRPLKSSEVFDDIYQTKIKVIGIGGGGSSIVSEIASQLKKVSFIAANTDAQALKKISKKCKRFSFGQNLTGGLGCGMNSELGKKAAQQARESIKEVLEDADLCILVSSLGGGTGSGASPIFAEVSQEFKNITFGIFTLPFKFEGEKKLKIALNSLEKLKPYLNAFTIIPNEKIFQIIDKTTPLKQSLSTLNKILGQGLEGLIEMIFLPGLINIDWADLKVILEGRGKLCYLNSIEARSDEEPEEMVRRVTQSPLSEYDPQKADKILYNITSDKDLRMDTVEQISRFITGFNQQAKIIFGISQYPSYKKKIRITLLATSDAQKEKVIKKRKKAKPKPKPKPVPEEEKSEEKKPEPKPEPEAKPKPKPKPKPKESPKRAKLILKKRKEKISKLEKKRPKKKKKIQIATPRAPKEKTRKSALQLRKEAEQIEKELLAEEKKWDIPAFLRKNTE